MSFVSGLDICDGRYNTGKYSLFHILNIESHCFEFDQINISGASLLVLLVTGEVVCDVLINFEHRWINHGSESKVMVKFTVKLTDPPPALASSISSGDEGRISPPHHQGRSILHHTQAALHYTARWAPPEMSLA
ncbi:hypothetical protein Q3G72_030619 [Acer saccharum]|nr:hypothetical protein Q3G72_030619 [Acer saccharum]